VEIDVLGKRVFRVRVPRRPAEETDDRPPVYETYDTTMVGFEWHFVPRMYAQMASKAPFVARCRESGLIAEVRHKPRKFAEGASGGFRVVGRVFHEADPGRTLFSIAGRYDARVTVRDLRGEEGSGSEANAKKGRKGLGPGRVPEVGVLYDAYAASRKEIAGFVREHNWAHESDGVKATEAVWGEVARAMDERRWDDAKRAKQKVERDERVERARRAKAGEAWTPRWFRWSEEEETWVLKEGAWKMERAEESAGGAIAAA
jgi:hypothetical protein